MYTFQNFDRGEKKKHLSRNIAIKFYLLPCQLIKAVSRTHFCRKCNMCFIRFYLLNFQMNWKHFWAPNKYHWHFFRPRLHFGVVFCEIVECVGGFSDSIAHRVKIAYSKSMQYNEWNGAHQGKQHHKSIMKWISHSFTENIIRDYTSAN